MLQLIQYQKTGEITVEDLPDIKLAPGGILVQNYYSLISAGTERTSVETAQASLIGKAKSRPDLVKQVIDNIKREGIKATYEKVMNRLDNYKELGYSSAGIVIESNIEEFRPGDRVACAGAGFASHSELVFIPKKLAVKLPDNVSFEEGAFTTLGAIALQGVRQADLRIGESVAVIGLGLLGLITVQLLKANGCKVIGFDINKNNFNLAKKCGCDKTAILDSNSEKIIESFTNGKGTDSVIITASTKSNEPLEKAISFARKKSNIVIVGVTGMNIPRSGFYEKELDIKIACSYGPGRYDYNYEQKGIDYPIGYVRWTENRNMESIVQLLSQEKLDFNKLVTHKIPITEGLKAYKLITGKIKEPYLGILIEYDKKIKKDFTSKKIIKEKINLKDIVVGFIGAGNFAQSNLLPNLNKCKVSLQNVVTLKSIDSKSVANKFGFNQFSNDANEIFNDAKINTVFVVTHHSSHAKYVIDSIKNNKNVFVEKPLAVSIEELEEIKKVYDKSKVNLLVGFNRRFSKPFQKIKEFFVENTEPFVINYRVNAGFIPMESWIQEPSQGGRIIGEGCHFIDVFDFIINSKPTSLYATTIRTNNSVMKNEDNVNITINYENGSIANLLYLANGDKNLPKEYCEIFSGGKTAIMQDFKKIILYQNSKSYTIKFDSKKGHKEEVEYFINLLRGKIENKLSFESIYTTTLITLKVHDSIKTGNLVKL
ncbi:MAG: bi-domain-containing oxidoreductase [Ignavibacteriales bacterium]|nr:bi-domain-containing oxidoreductase [Ignavibacteriales bacterium]